MVASARVAIDAAAAHASWQAQGGSSAGTLGLCYRIRDLPLGASLHLAAYASPRHADSDCDQLLATATFALFSRTARRLKTGQYTVVLSAPPATAATDAFSTACRASVRAPALADMETAAAALANASRGLRLFARRSGGVTGHAPDDWLDNASLPRLTAQLKSAQRTCVDAGLVLLTFSVQTGCEAPVLHTEGPTSSLIPPPASSPALAQQQQHPGLGAYATQLTWFDDVPRGTDDPCNRRLARLARRMMPLLGAAALRNSSLSATAAPDGQQRRALAACLKSPPSRLPDAQQRELLWSFRHNLARSEPLALPRFLAAVDWSDAGEAAAASEVLPAWMVPASGHECACLAVWLLSPPFEHAAVRAHAAGKLLGAASDEDCAEVLLQFVQALQWEPEDQSPLANALLSRAATSLTLATLLHWYLTVERSDGGRFAPRAAAVHAELFARCSPIVGAGLASQTALVSQLEGLSGALATVRGHGRKRERLRQLLTTPPSDGLLALRPPVPWPLDPAVCVDGVVIAAATVFKSALAPLRLTFHVNSSQVAAASAALPPLSPLPPEGHTPRLDAVSLGDEGDEFMLPSSDDEVEEDEAIERSDTPPPMLLQPSGIITSPGGTPIDGPAAAAAAAATAAAQSLAGAMSSLSGLGFAAATAAADGLASFLPSSAADADTQGVSQSPGSPMAALPPVLVHTPPQHAAAAPQVAVVHQSPQHVPSSVTLIYKQGDDLRQDQLCLQFVCAVDRLLKADGLDLRLTPYRVLATSPTAGIVQFVPGAVTCSGVLAEHRTLLRFFATVAPDPRGSASSSGSSFPGCSERVYDTFLRSCAGYSVITYLLGVGDRHLDNLMLCPDGRLFHIDFGYLFGRDPKQWPGAPAPAMKLSKELTDAMGGTAADCPGWLRFRTIACEAFGICRKHAPQLCALLRPMGGAGMRDVSPEAALRVEAKLELDLSAEEAAARFAQLLADSASAALEGLKENVHRVAQYLR